MSRIAVVTGGTRGIGEAICLKLQEKGRMVIANYGGNDHPVFEASGKRPDGHRQLWWQ